MGIVLVRMRLDLCRLAVGANASRAELHDRLEQGVDSGAKMLSSDVSMVQASCVGHSQRVGQRLR